MLRHLWLCLAVLALTWSGPVRAQEEAAQEAAVEEAAPADEVPLLAPEELEALVARIAFYPDPVLAVTLPASTYPLDIVQAARFLEQQKSQPDAQPSENWDPSILSLLNYPVVLNMMNEDLDWTTQLGEAVLNQQGDVIDAIQQVRRTAYTAGQLQSNDQVTVVYENDTIEIDCTDPDKVYIPIYEPSPAPVEPAQLPAEGTATAEQLPADGSTTVENTTINNYYPQNGMAYSEPYTPYYNESAAFWTGALVGGVTMGFLMDWDDDDIDIDFDDGDWDDWEPGRGDINIDGDVNIGNDVNIGKGDSWRDMRAQRGERANQLPSASKASARKGAQPAASQSARKAKAAQRPASGTNAKQRPAQNKAGAQKPRKATTTKQKPAQNKGSLGNVERGQQTKKATNRGSGSQQKQLQTQQKRQQAAPTNKQRQNVNKPRQNQNMNKPQKRKGGSSGAFGPSGNGKQMKKSSNRGGGSQVKRQRR
jgi:hypothetical protein